jgi:hypothetical protein
VEEYFKKHPRTYIYERLETKNEILPNAIFKAHEHEIALEEEIKPLKELVKRAEKSWKTLYGIAQDMVDRGGRQRKSQQWVWTSMNRYQYSP